MTDRAFVTLITAVLAFVIGLAVMSLYGSAWVECEETHGVLVTSASGFGWECVEKK